MKCRKCKKELAFRQYDNRDHCELCLHDLRVWISFYDILEKLYIGPVASILHISSFIFNFFLTEFIYNSIFIFDFGLYDIIISLFIFIVLQLILYFIIDFFIKFSVNFFTYTEAYFVRHEISITKYLYEIFNLIGISKIRFVDYLGDEDYIAVRL